MSAASRQLDPVVGIIVGEEPTCCVYCGTRTEWFGGRREQCPKCGQRYEVYDDEEEEPQ